MLWEDVVIVTDLINRYGYSGPMIHFEGEASPLYIDLQTSPGKNSPGVPKPFSTPHRPFAHIDAEYTSESLTNVRTPLALPLYLRGRCATALYLNQLHKAEDPVETMKVLQALLKPGGLLIVTAPFAYPYEPQANDLWRFTPDGLRRLGMRADLHVLDTSWHINVSSDCGFLNPRTNETLEVRACFGAFGSGPLAQREKKKVVLPTERKY